MLQKKRDEAKEAQKVAESVRAKAAKKRGRPIVKPKPKVIKRKVEEPDNPPQKRQKKLSHFFSVLPKK